MKTFPLVVVLLLILVSVARGEDIRARAVELARQGMLDTAVEMLEQLRRDAPDDAALLSDLITVLNWAGRHDRVVVLARTLDTDSLPSFALRAVAGSARRGDDATTALEYYQMLLSREDRGAEDLVGYSLTLSDAGQPGQALSVTAAARRQYGTSAAIEFSGGYAQFRAGRYVHAITLCREALALDPEYGDAARLLVRSLELLGATGVAYRIAGQHADALPSEEHLHVANDRNATWVRWGALDQGRDPGQRFRDTDIALQRLEALEQRTTGRSDLPTELLHVITFDRMVALRDRVRMDDVIALYRELRADDIPLPDYARRAAADAFLYLEQPDHAASLYRSVLGDDPGNFDARIGLFYALLEQEDFSSAREVIERLLEDLPAVRRSPDRRTIAPNYHWLEASITAAMLEAFADRLDVAVERITALVRRAPHNARMSRELSTLYRWRGWAHLALEEARIGRTNFPDDTGLVLAEVGALMDLGHYRDAESLAESLFHHYPENKAVQRLGRELDTFHSPRLESYYSRARSTAENLVRGERSLAYGIRLDSAPIAHHSSLFAAGDRRDATFFGNRFRHDRVALGYGYRYAGVRMSLGVTDSRVDIDKEGLLAHAGVEVGDHFAVDIDYESVTLETPLRAAAAGHHADRLSLTLGYDSHESRNLRLGLGRMNFSDGNTRESGTLAWEERWRSGPIYRLYTFVDAYASRNSLADAEYFNPESDSDINLTLRQRWKTWRHYSRSFHQVLDLSLGRYSQSGFVDGTTWGIRYEHTFEHDQEYVLSYGVRRARDFYDGQPEYVDELFVRYQHVF